MKNSLQPLALALKQVQDLHHRALDTRLAPLGISMVQWNALREIDKNPGSSLHRLAELTFNSDQAFGTLANRLLRQGFVRRQPGEGRAIVHSLTPKGKNLLDQGRGIVREVFAASFAPLDGEERAVLFQLLTKLLNG